MIQIEGRKRQLGDFRVRCSVLSPRPCSIGSTQARAQKASFSNPRAQQSPGECCRYSSEHLHALKRTQSRCMPTSSKICVCSNKSIHDINGKRSYHRISRNIKMKNYLIKHVTLTESPVSANGGQHVQGSRLRWPDMTPSVPSYTSPTDWA